MKTVRLLTIVLLAFFVSFGIQADEDDNGNRPVSIPFVTEPGGRIDKFSSILVDGHGSFLLLCDRILSGRHAQVAGQFLLVRILPEAGIINRAV